MAVTHRDTTVEVFHNLNQRFRVAGDPDACANLTYVATVKVPPDEARPLEYAFRVTNHGHPVCPNWTQHPSIFDTGSTITPRSTSVGDVLELYQDGTTTRHIIEDVGFRQL